MTRTHPLSRFMPYGAPELLASEEPRLTRAVLAGSLTMIAAFALALVLVPNAVRHRAPIYIAPSIDLMDEIPTITPPPPAPEIPAIVRPQQSDLGTIEPVVDAPPIEWEEVPPGQGTEQDGVVFDDGDAARTPPAVTSTGEDPPVRGEPQYVDQLPMAQVEFKPEYPSFARDAGVEGLVVVHALVGRDGHVIQVELDEKFSVPLLDQTALDGARRWVFKPASVNGNPVPAWVAVTFRFTLH